MKDYKVDFIEAKGRRNYRTFDTREKAMKFYLKCGGQAVIKEYNPNTFEYEVVYDPSDNVE